MNYLIRPDLRKTRKKAWLSPEMPSTRRFRPSGGKREALGRNGICHRVKPAASSKTATKTLHSEADKTGRTDKDEKKTLSYYALTFTERLGQKNPTLICLFSLFPMEWLAKEQRSGWRLWRVASGLVRRNQPFYQKTKTPQWYRRRKNKKKIKPLGMTGAPSWSITLRVPIYFGP